MAYYGSHNTSKRLKNQSQWSQQLKDRFWKKIVEQKIDSQISALRKAGVDDNLINPITKFRHDVRLGGTTNREAHAARLYFKALFGDRFIRGVGDNIDSALDYGYSLLLSSFNKEIVSSGYSTSLGINHTNEFNPFNLSSDLMEPFRPIIDLKVYKMKGFEFDSFFKDELIKILETRIELDDVNQHVNHAIYQYVGSFFRAMESDDISMMSEIKV